MLKQILKDLAKFFIFIALILAGLVYKEGFDALPGILQLYADAIDYAVNKGGWKKILPVLFMVGSIIALYILALFFKYNTRFSHALSDVLALFTRDYMNQRNLLIFFVIFLIFVWWFGGFDLILSTEWDLSD